jgi:hypothetical protein
MLLNEQEELECQRAWDDMALDIHFPGTPFWDMLTEYQREMFRLFAFHLRDQWESEESEQQKG